MYTQCEFTWAMDVFSMGCLFAYVLSGGVHPFGVEKEDRIVNIKKKQPMSFTIQHLNGVVGAAGVFDLICSMLSFDPEERPTASAVFKDPFFNRVSTLSSSVPPVNEATAASSSTSTLLQTESGNVIFSANLCAFTIIIGYFIADNLNITIKSEPMDDDDSFNSASTPNNRVSYGEPAAKRIKQEEGETRSTTPLLIFAPSPLPNQNIPWTTNSVSSTCQLTSPPCSSSLDATAVTSLLPPSTTQSPSPSSPVALSTSRGDGSLTAPNRLIRILNKLLDLRFDVIFIP